MCRLDMGGGGWEEDEEGNEDGGWGMRRGDGGWGMNGIRFYRYDVWLEICG